MVKGLDRFKEHFALYAECYVLIGGAASSLSMEELGGEFRATKDLDLVLCVESLDRDFAVVFWEFIRLGKYENRQKSTGKKWTPGTSANTRTTSSGCSPCWIGMLESL